MTLSTEWKPIETVPKDGSPVLLGCVDGGGSYEVCAATWKERRSWWVANGTEENLYWTTPIAWAPIPAFDGGQFANGEPLNTKEG